MSKDAPKKIFLVGPSGSGKSVIAELVAAETGFLLVDTDDYVVENSEFDSVSDIFDERGEAHFRSLEVSCVDDLESWGESIIVATGGGLPANPGIADRLKKIGKTVYLKATLEELWERLSGNDGELAKRPLLATGGIDKLDELMRLRHDIYHASSIVVDTDDLFVEEVSALLVGLIRDEGGESHLSWAR